MLAGLWGRVTSTAQATGELETFMKSMTAALSDRGSKVLMLGQVPPNNPASARCEGLRLYLGMQHETCGRIERAAVDKMNEPARLALSSAENGNVKYYSPVDVFCDRAYCYSSKAGRWLYADAHHLNAEGGALTVETIRFAVSALNPGISIRQALIGLPADKARTQSVSGKV